MPKLFDLSDSVMPIQAVTADQIANMNRYSVVSGCGITWNNNLTATIAPGQLLVDGEVSDFAGRTYDMTALRPAGALQRWVLMCHGAGEARSQPAGVAAQNNPPASYPLMPDVPAEQVLLGAALLRATDASLAAVKAARRAFDLRLPAPPQVNRANEHVTILAADHQPGLAEAAPMQRAHTNLTASSQVQLRLGLRLRIPAAGGFTIDYRVLRKTPAGVTIATVLDVARVPHTEAQPSGFDVEFPFFDSPGTTDALRYDFMVKRSGGNAADFSVHRGSYLYAREIN